MKLTGKCLEAFEKWLKKQPFVNHNRYTKLLIIHGKVYTDLNELFIDTLIIEFFDSVWIYITVMACNDKTFDSEIRTNKINIMTSQFMEKRTQATNEAIIKANDLYNENN